MAEYAGLDLDKVYDNDEHFIDENLEWSDDNKKLKRAPKHNDRKYTQHIIGVKLAKNVAHYTAQALIERMSASILEDNTISDVTKLSERRILTNSGSHETSLPKFLALVLAISKGEPNTISTRGRVLLLERTNANSDSMLMEFIKFGSSEVLKKREEESTERK